MIRRMSVLALWVLGLMLAGTVTMNAFAMDDYEEEWEDDFEEEYEIEDDLDYDEDEEYEDEEEYEEEEEDEEEDEDSDPHGYMDLPVNYESARMDMPQYFQCPDLPTGCEVTALAMALGVEGYDVSPVTLAKKYMHYHKTDMAKGYVGDPFTEEGSGIFPPGLTDSANDYLSSQGSSLEAVNISGCSFEDLLNYLGEECPVVAWVTLSYEDPKWVDDGSEVDGFSYEWYSNEHCVALRGYDLEDGLILIGDPSEGGVEMDLFEFKYLWEEIGSLAVVLM